MDEIPEGLLSEEDIPYSIDVVGFSAEDRNGAEIDLSSDPEQPIFIRKQDGDRWPADSFVGYFLMDAEKNIHDFGPEELEVGEAYPVSFPVKLPQGSFYVETKDGDVDVATVTVRVEFRLRVN
ncbi:MAG: hypothetical protein ACTSWI_04795 [Alphaproteobacteria bacterium]